MSVIINGIACEELVAGYREAADRRGVTSTKGFLCDWADRFTVAQGLLGITSAAGIGGLITWTIPAAHPQLYNCYCVGVEFEPAGIPTQGAAQITWTKCKVWAHYGTISYNWGPQMQIDPTTPFLWAEQEIDVGTEVVTVSGQKLKFAGGNPLDHDWGIRIAIVDFKITLFQVPYLPGGTILSKAGAINDSTYLGVAAGQLLFNGAQNRGQLMNNGIYVQNITYSFTARQYPWDYAYNGATNAWAKVVTSGGSDIITRQSFVGIFPGEYV